MINIVVKILCLFDSEADFKDTQMLFKINPRSIFLIKYSCIHTTDKFQILFFLDFFLEFHTD